MKRFICRPKLRAGLRLSFGILALIGLASPAGAADRPFGTIADAELEQNYWYCDWQASLSADAGERSDEGLMQFCAGISHELQVRKFDDDFARLHQWTTASRATASRDSARLRKTPPVPYLPAHLI